jgi:membrane protein DedA with SNARE-associated domain
MTDAIVDPIVNAATDFIDATGLVGIFVLMALESACIPVPSEAIMLFAGFNVSEGDMTMFGIVAAGSLGNLAACCGPARWSPMPRAITAASS